MPPKIMNTYYMSKQGDDQSKSVIDDAPRSEQEQAIERNDTEEKVTKKTK